MLLLSHHQQFICLDLFSHQTNIIRDTLLWTRQWQLPIKQNISACRYCCSTLSKSNTISIFASTSKDTSNTTTMSFLSKLTIPHLAVRGIQVFFSLMVLILSAYGTSVVVDHDIPLHGMDANRHTAVANWYNTSTLVSSPAQINVMLVSAIFSLVSVTLLEVLPKFVPFCKPPFPPKPIPAEQTTNPPPYQSQTPTSA